MFQLIVAVISIALVAALAIASIFYGGSAFSSSSQKANVTALVNQAQQISGAYTLYKTEKGKAPTAGDEIDEMVSGNYLASAPPRSKIATTEWGVESLTIAPAVTASLYATITLADGVATNDTCKEINRQAGNTVDADINAGTFLPTAQFRCNANKFVFKL